MRKDVFPVNELLLSRSEREQRLQQKSKALWLTGLSGAGKTSIAVGLERRLFSAGFFVQVLDGDHLRSGLNNNLGFSAEDRLENIRRSAELAKLFLQSGIISINCYISPLQAHRNLARQIIGPSDFFEIYINAPLNTCEQRDVKGLYKKARKGELTDFTGVSAPYETPLLPDHEIHTDLLSVEQSVDQLFGFILPYIGHKGF